MKLSVVSPERWEMNWRVAGRPANGMASRVSVTVPIWFSLMRAELAALRSMPSRMMAGLVTNRSSPTSWMRWPRRAVSLSHPSQSFSPRPSSINQMG